VKAVGKIWAEIKRMSQRRVRWKGVVEILCSSRNQEA
jgi:hypothetical protein